MFRLRCFMVFIGSRCYLGGSAILMLCYADSEIAMHFITKFKFKFNRFESKQITLNISASKEKNRVDLD